MSDEKFNADDYEKDRPTPCAGCIAGESDNGLCEFLADLGCGNGYVFKLKDKSKGESDD